MSGDVNLVTVSQDSGALQIAAGNGEDRLVFASDPNLFAGDLVISADGNVLTVGDLQITLFDIESIDFTFPFATSLTLDISALEGIDQVLITPTEGADTIVLGPAEETIRYGGLDSPNISSEGDLIEGIQSPDRIEFSLDTIFPFNFRSQLFRVPVDDASTTITFRDSGTGLFDDSLDLVGSFVVQFDFFTTSFGDITLDGRNALQFLPLIFGSFEDDTIVGLENSAVAVSGFSGDDNIVTFAGDDIIEPGGGDDIVNSGAGDDEIGGSFGNDILNAGDGRDFIEGGPGVDIIDAGAGDDFISTFVDGDIIDGGPGFDRVSVSQETFPVVIDLINGTISGVGTTPLVTQVTISNIESVFGTSSDDTIIGDNGINDLVGQTGDDIIFGNGGDDDLYGGPGNDRLEGGAGSDFLSDFLGNDILIGGPGADILSGGLGDDVLVIEVAPGDGLEEASGGVGRDQFIIDGTVETGDLLLNDLRPGDTIVLTGVTLSDNFIGAGFSFGNPVLAIGAGNGFSGLVIEISEELANFGEFSFNVQGNDTVIEISGDLVGEFDDIITGTSSDDFLEGFGGDDQIIGGAGDDRIVGGEGDDILDGGDGDDTIFLGQGSDIVIGGEGFDTLGLEFSVSRVVLDEANGLIRFVDVDGQIVAVQFTGIEDFGPFTFREASSDSSSDNDTVAGSDGADTLFGGAGIDLILGQEGDDTLSGDEGDDTLVGGAGADTLDGGEGFDTADYTFDGVEEGILTIDLLMPGRNTGAAEGDTYINIEQIQGSNGRDSIAGDAGDNILIGGAARDFLNGRAGDDLLQGGDGDDVLDGRSGDDVLAGGSGADMLIGDSGVDFADFSADALASDILIVDLLLQSRGTGAAAGDSFQGIEGVIGSEGRDSIAGDAGDNILIGGAARDFLNGRAGDDILQGGDGADVLDGRAGDDVLDGGAGDDLLIGDAGSDTFVFGSGMDTVADFNAADGDIIELDDALGITSFTQLESLLSETDAGVVIDFGAGNSLTLLGLGLTDLTAQDFGL